MGNDQFTTEQRKEIDKIKKQMKNGEQITLLCNGKQKIKLIKICKKVYEVTYNYGDKNFVDCIVDMYLCR